MGWKRSGVKVQRDPLAYAAPGQTGTRIHDAPAGGSSTGASGSGVPVGEQQGPDPGDAATTLPANAEDVIQSKRLRRSLSVYDLHSGEDLEAPVHLDNSLLQVMFPDLQITLGQVSPPPAGSSLKEVESHWQAALEDLARDLDVDAGGSGPMALDVATGARKEGRFLFSNGQVGRQVADTFEKIMAYGGLLVSPCLQPPKHVEQVRVLVVPEGEMGTGDCAGKMSARLAKLWGKDGSQAGQFRLGVRLDEDTVLVGKGTLKRMHWTDVDATGQGYDLILPDSSFKGNVPAFGEHVWDIYLGFNGWSGERRTRLSYQILQWFDPELVEQCIFPRAELKIPLLLEAMKSREGACRFLQIERQERMAEHFGKLSGVDQEADAGDPEAEGPGEEERAPSILEQVLAADRTGQVFDHPYVQKGLRRRLRQAWHDLAVGGGVKVPSFMGLPDSFGGAACDEPGRIVDWLPEGLIVCPDLPPGEVLVTRYPIRTRHDVQIWRNVDWEALQALAVEVGLDPRQVSRFFRYAREHQGVAFMSHATAKRVGGDFDGDVFQIMPITSHKPLDEIQHPNRDWSDLAPLIDQVRQEGWGSAGTTPKVKRRLATHVAPESPKDVTAENRPWLASAAIQQGGHREAFLVALGQHLHAWDIDGEDKVALTASLGELAADPERSLDEAVAIAEDHGLDALAWMEDRGDSGQHIFDLARDYNRRQMARQALKNMDSSLGQIVYTISRVNASQRFAPEEREATISRLAEELQAEVDKFKYDTAADMDYVGEVRKKVGRELVWLDVHKDPSVFVTDTRLSPSPDAVSHLWNHVSRHFQAWQRATQPPRHFKDLLPAEFTPDQYATARQQVRTYNRTIARAFQNNDEKALVSAIQVMEAWSEGYTDPGERQAMARAVWHAAHESTRVGGTASAAFHAFLPELLLQLAAPRPQPAREIVILGAQHESNLGARIADYDQPQTVRLRVLLEDYTDTYGCTERRLAAYELDEEDEPRQRLGYLPKDAPRREGRYLAELQRPAGKRRIEGRLSPLSDDGGRA